jgi:hypothetical protein
MKISDTPAGAASKAEKGMRQIIGKKYGDSFPDPLLMSVAVDLSSRNIGACVVLDKGAVTRLRPDGGGGLVAFDPDAPPPGPPPGGARRVPAGPDAKGPTGAKGAKGGGKAKGVGPGSGKRPSGRRPKP